MNLKKTSKNITVIAFAILLSFSCGNNILAQIKFEHGTWEEIKAKAKAENKLIFMDAYTSWCGLVNGWQQPFLQMIRWPDIIMLLT